jgi:hypothetical protein
LASPACAVRKRGDAVFIARAAAHCAGSRARPDDRAEAPRPYLHSRVTESPADDSDQFAVDNRWYQIRDPPDDTDDVDRDTVLLLGHWRYPGRGHSPGEGLLARTIAQDIADNRRIALIAAQEDDRWPA